MKIKCNSDEFIKVINQASKIATKNNINPVFECIYIRTEDHKLIIKTTNLEILYEKSINVLTEINGEVYIKSDILNRLVSNLQKNTNLEIEKIDNKLSIKNEKETLEIDIFDINESFPNSPVSNDSILTVPIKTLVEGFKNVSFAASKSEIKPEISSVYIYNKDDFLNFVATDSYRLAEKRTNQINILKDFSYIIPIKNVLNIISILDDENQDNDIILTEYNDGIILENDNIFISTRIINGNYPDYKQLFPKEFNNELEINKTELVKALNLNNLITTQYNFTKIKYDLNQKSATITAEEKSRGNVKSFVNFDIKNSKAELEETNYNTGYFLEGLSKISSEKVLMNYTIENKPVFIKNNNDLSFVYLLMPLNR
ncbi:MAG: polymerase subunit beta [Patescibacteria group bacterium]|nr:polymerase subunit beta [Patescibacteria group bacterium]